MVPKSLIVPPSPPQPFQIYSFGFLLLYFLNSLSSLQKPPSGISVFHCNILDISKRESSWTSCVQEAVAAPGEEGQGCFFWMLLLKAVGAWSHRLAGGPVQRGREETKGSSLLPWLSGAASHRGREHDDSGATSRGLFQSKKKRGFLLMSARNKKAVTAAAGKQDGSKSRLPSHTLCFLMPPPTWRSPPSEGGLSVVQ